MLQLDKVDDYAGHLVLNEEGAVLGIIFNIIIKIEKKLI